MLGWGTGKRSNSDTAGRLFIGKVSPGGKNPVSTTGPVNKVKSPESERTDANSSNEQQSTKTISGQGAGPRLHLKSAAHCTGCAL